LYDGLAWDALDFASAEGSPDNVVGIIADHGELWVFGETTTEVWYNAGTPGFPFAPIQGAFSEIGCAAPNSIAKINNTVFWVGRSTTGQGIVYMSQGYTPKRVSTHAVEWQLQQTPNTVINNAYSYTYQQDGHVFYVMNIPNLGTTFVYDVSTESWHERQSLLNGSQSCHLGNCQAFITNPLSSLSSINIIGDYSSGTLYYFDLNTYTDNNQEQTWLRSWRALASGQNNLKRTAHHSLQIDMDTNYADENIINLRWSDDGGNTWNTSRSATTGTGFGNPRVIFRRLGMTMKLRDRVYEISGSSVAPIYIMGAELLMSPTDA
jgi:hypothetical protein